MFLIKNSHFLCSLNMFKVSHLISNYTLLKDLIFWLNQLHVNHKSNVFQFIIIMYHTTIVPFQVWHKLYYFHFCQIFQKKKHWMSKILKIQSKRPDSNPQPIQQRIEKFHQFNQKHNKKLMKRVLLYLFIICWKFQN